jgi:hypothetical protein
VFAEAKKIEFKGAAWQIVRPVVASATPVYFSPDEMALLLSLDNEVFNDVAALDDLHNSTAALCDLYGQSDSAFLTILGEPQMAHRYPAR